MRSKSLFIVIEGLDGSGKTSVARQLAYHFQSTSNKKVKLTFEPHDPSCCGLFIRQVLEKKIRKFSHETLMLAFAANRMDHCDREINKWLDEGANKVIICDRYYLSSLVYQSNENFDFDHVMDLNKHARKPDVTFFMNVTNKVCYERMKRRNKPKELFERDLSKTRDKYLDAISFLKEKREENIINIDASGTMKEVLRSMINHVYELYPWLRSEQLSLVSPIEIKQPNVFSLNGEIPNLSEEIIKEEITTLESEENFNSKIIRKRIEVRFSKLEFNDKGFIFFNFLNTHGYNLTSETRKLPWTHLDAYELEYTLPGGILQRGTALFVNENQRYDIILGSVSKLDKMSDFMFVFSPGPAELVTTYYERDVMMLKSGESLNPSTLIITEKHLEDFIFDSLQNRIQDNPITKLSVKT